MKHDTQNPLIVAPREEREIIDEIRNDHDLIERLKITAQELDALSKCSLFGTLTCKQDMLFILRQIREATSRATGQPTLFPGPARIEDQEEDDPLPDFRHMPVRIAPAIIAEPASLDGIIRRRQLEYFGVFFWVLVLFAGLAWTGVTALSRWRANFFTSIGMPDCRVPASDAWFRHLNRLDVLLSLEILFVSAIAAVMYLKSRGGPRRLR